MSDSLPSPPWRRIFLASLVAGAVVIGLTGAAPELNYPSDTANYLDASSAAAAGLRLQRDFFSPIGPAAILPTVVAMRLRGPTVAALAGGAALAWLGYGLVAWAVAARRMPGPLAAGFALFVAGTAAAPYTLDFGDWHSLSYGMLYNRLAWAALCIAACPAFLRGSGTKRLAWAAAGHGACAAWLWLIKPNYVLIQIPLTVWAMVAIQGQRRPVATVAWFLAGAAAATALVAGCVPFDPVGYVREHFAMAHDAPPELLRYTLVRSLHENLLPLAVLGLAWLVAAMGLASLGARVSLLALLVLVGGATFVANMTNCQFAEFPLLGALGWILAGHVVGAVRRTRPGLLAAATGIGLGLAYAWQPWSAIAYAQVWKRTHPAPSARAAIVASPAWADMPMEYAPGAALPGAAGNPAGSAGDYATWLNDGLALLARVPRPAGAILCLDWGNPFPFATGTRPALGDQIAWHVGRYISLDHHPDVGRLLDQAAAVMEPKDSVLPDALAFKRTIFADRLQADFAPAGESAGWRIWLRRPDRKIAASP
jgi:hypothetical protein